MDEKLYSIEEVASILNLHHKTIRRYITSGELRANKVGKQWRISGHDLSLFLESSNIELGLVKNNETEVIEHITNSDVEIEDISVSSVVDIKNITHDDYNRISNSLLAVMNTPEVRRSKASINMKYSKEMQNLKIMLWGSLEFNKELLDLISIFTEK